MALILIGLLGNSANADITAVNKDRDRAPFVKCGEAVGIMSQSAHGLEDATIACITSAKFYAKKTVEAKTHDDKCLYQLYLGSSFERLGAITSRSLNNDGSKKMYSTGDDVLASVIENCADNPNILAGAKGVLRASQQLR